MNDHLRPSANSEQIAMSAMIEATAISATLCPIVSNCTAWQRTARPLEAVYSRKEDDCGQHCRCQTQHDDAPTVQAVVSHEEQLKPIREKVASALCAKIRNAPLLFSNEAGGANRPASNDARSVL